MFSISDSITASNIVRSGSCMDGRLLILSHATSTKLINKYKKQIQKIDKKVGMEYTKKHKNKDRKDGNKGQGSSLATSFCPQLWLFIYQTLQIVF